MNIAVTIWACHIASKHCSFWTPSIVSRIKTSKLMKQEAFEKCWAHSPLRSAARPFTRCSYCRIGYWSPEGGDASACQISSQSVNRLWRYWDFSIFQDGGRPQSWICLGHIWTTNSEYMGVSITLQNLVMIDAVVFISRLCIDVHDDDVDDDDDNDNDNAWLRGPLWPYGMGPIRSPADAEIVQHASHILLGLCCRRHLQMVVYYLIRRMRVPLCILMLI